MGFSSPSGTPSSSGSLIARRHLRPIIKASILFLSLALAVLLLQYGQEAGVFDLSWLNAHVKDRGLAGWALFMGIVGVFSAVGTPRQLLATLGGYVFGALLGTLLVSCGLVFGCAAGFFYARLLARGSVQRRFGQRIRKFEDFLLCRPFLTIIAVRFLPVGNNALTNLIGGITRVPAVPFLAGSCIGYLPQTIIFALLGSGIAVDAEARMAASFLLLIASTAISIRLYRRIKRERADIGIASDDNEEGVVSPVEGNSPSGNGGHGAS